MVLAYPRLVRPRRLCLHSRRGRNLRDPTTLPHTACVGESTCRKARHLLTDPQSITINAVANSLPRVSTGNHQSTYQKDDGNVKLIVSSAYGKRTRRTARVEYRKTAQDPLFPAQNTPYSMSCYIVVDVPVVGFSVTEQKQIVDAVTAWLSASSGANVTKLLGGES